jgi:hypothetical protein
MNVLEPAAGGSKGGGGAGGTPGGVHSAGAIMMHGHNGGGYPPGSPPPPGAGDTVSPLPFASPPAQIGTGHTTQSQRRTASRVRLEQSFASFEAASAGKDGGEPRDLEAALSSAIKNGSGGGVSDPPSPKGTVFKVGLLNTT